MPLDQANYISSGNQKLLRLARTLRNGDCPPEGGWQYASCHTCALEVARILFGYTDAGSFLLDHEELFELTTEEANRIFISAGHERGISMYKVQPEHVAEVIEELIEAKIYA